MSDISQGSISTTSLEEWDPFSACHSVPPIGHRGGSLTDRYWQEVLQGALTLATAYGMIKGVAGGGNEIQLRAIQDALADIRREIAMVNQNLLRIQQILAELPLVIRGIVSDGLFRDAMGAALAAAGSVKDFSAPEHVDFHHRELELALRSLEDALGRCKGSKGFYGVLITSPLVSTWLCGTIALESSKAKTTPGHKPYSPWKRTIVVEAGDALKLFCENIRAIRPHYEVELVPRIPIHMRPAYEYLSDDGVRLLRARGNIPNHGDYRLVCPDLGGQFERLERLGASGWTSATDYLSEQLLVNVQKQRNEIQSYAVFSLKFQQHEASLLESFEEIPNLW